MIVQRWIRTSFLILVALTVMTACNNHSSGMNTSTHAGDVRVKLTAAQATTGTTAAASVRSGSTVSSGTTVLNDMGDMGGGSILSSLTQVNVTFSSLLARNLDGELINMTITLPTTVDLISLINGKTVTLPMGTLPAGMYDQIVVVITHVQFVFVDGKKVDLTPPGGGWTKIISVTPFQVVDGQTTTIELHFNPSNAFGESDGEFEFFPDFDCHED
jgi:uncharacterized protein DUF4382